MAQRRKRASKGKEDAPTRGTAPSAANIRDLKKFEASDEAKAHEPSEVDAMGKDKRRDVIGQAYGPSRRSQFLVLGSVIAFFVIVVVGFSMLASNADKRPETNPDKAPWSKADAPQRPAVRPQ